MVCGSPNLGFFFITYDIQYIYRPKVCHCTWLNNCTSNYACRMYDFNFI
nr:MAG TPA: hypothetical protein [Bacteriophage sp.]